MEISGERLQLNGEDTLREGWGDVFTRMSNPWSPLLNVFAYMTDGILIMNHFRQIVGINRAAEEMLGWTNEDLLNSVAFCQLCDGVVSNREDTLATCLNCQVFTENSPYVELVLKAKDGREVTVTASSTIMAATADVPACTIVAIRDISAQKRQAKARMSRLLSNKMMQTLEEERKRVSKELHDGIGQNVFSMQMMLDLLLGQLDGHPSAEMCGNVRQMTAQVLEEVRNLSVELRPSILDDLGLIPAIRSTVKRMEAAAPFEMTFTYNRNRRLSAERELALYRIFQEALNNALKYSEAEHFQVDVLFEEGDRAPVMLTVIDDGKGFLPDQLGESGRGLGLFSMRERVAQLNGKIHIDSRVGEGTHIRVWLPQGGENCE